MINLFVINLLPLGWRPVHDDVDPEDLHGIQRVGEIHKCCQGDESKGSNAPKESEHKDLEITLSLFITWIVSSIIHTRKKLLYSTSKSNKRKMNTKI